MPHARANWQGNNSFRDHQNQREKPTRATGDPNSPNLTFCKTVARRAIYVGVDLEL